MYVTTGKGLAHVENSFTSNQQTDADIAALIHEGLRRVSHIKRSYYDQDRAAVRLGADGPFYNFPTIKGRLFHGVTFEPLSNIEVSLFLGEKLVPMFDNRWQNPYTIAETTAGTYLFWPQPIKTEEEGVNHTFSFELYATGHGFEEFNHFFEVSSISESIIRDSFEIPQTYRIEDLYLFPK
jgi:competence protein ComFB